MSSVQDNIDYFKNRRLLVHDTVYRVKIEMSLGCNRSCDFCGMTRKESHLLNRELFYKIVDKIPKTVKRIEMILHGEPTLNPNLPEYVSKLNLEFPKSQLALCSNGFRFLVYKYDPDYLFDLFERGINLFQICLYEIEDYNKFLQLVNENEARFKEIGISIRDLYNSDCNMFFSYRGKNNREIIYVKEYEGLNSGKSKQRRFHTFGGNVPYDYWKRFSIKYPDFKSFPHTGKGKTCTSLLKYLSIGAKGDLYLCCRDASHSLNIGHILNDDLNELWYSEKLQKIRLVLASARRDLIASCFLCSRFCYRDPLYPYWGESYKKEDCIETIHSITDIKDDVLLDNLIRFREEYPEKLPEHILNEIKTSEEKYRRT